MIRFLRRGLYEFSEVGEIADCARFRSLESIIVVMSDWDDISGIVFNVFSPVNAVFFNFAAQQKLESASFAFRQQVISGITIERISDSLRSFHLNPGSVPAITFDGRILAGFGDRFFVVPPRAELFWRRHFSLVVARRDANSFADHLERQVAAFSTSSTVKRDESSACNYNWSPSSSRGVNELLSSSAQSWMGSDSFPSKVVSQFIEENYGGCWSDPCPIYLADEGLAGSRWLAEVRLEALLQLGTYQVLVGALKLIEWAKLQSPDFFELASFKISEKLAKFRGL